MKLSDGEKLMILMLCDMAKQLKVTKGEFNYDFIATTIHNNHLWGFDWEYQGIPFERTDTPSDVNETCDILDMFYLLEGAFAKLSTADKQRLQKEAEPFGTEIRFNGFDGNHERHYGIACYLVDDMKRFSHFKGRDLNSHHPSIDGYRRMYQVFEPLRAKLVGRELSVDELIAILRARAYPG